MAKATDNTPDPRVGRTVTVQLTVPKSKALYEILLGTGRITGAAAEKALHVIAAKADPRDTSVPVVTLLGQRTASGRVAEADAAADGLVILLRKARAEGHEAADQLATLAAQLGVWEPEPEPVSGHGPPAPSAA